MEKAGFPLLSLVGAMYISDLPSKEWRDRPRPPNQL